MQELAPPRGAGAPPKLPPRVVAAVLVGSLAAACVFTAPLLLGGPLSGRDWSNHHWHYFDWVRTSLGAHGAVPLFMADAWVTTNFLANAESPALSPLAPLLLALPTGAFLKLLIALFTAAGLAGMLLLLRDLGVSPLAALVPSAAFAFGGFFSSHLTAGHPWALGAQLLPWMLMLFRRAALGSGAALVAAAALDAGAILTGQHQPFIWQNLVLGAFALLWSLRVRAWFPLARLALLWLVAAGLGAVKLLPMWLEFADYAPQERIVGLSPALVLRSLLAPGQHTGLVPAGLAYEHGAGWWEYAFYVGAPAFALLAAGVAAARGAWPLVAIGVGFLWLCLAWPPGLRGLDAWSALQDLPVLRTQRAPSRFLVLAVFAFSVVGGMGLERLLRRARTRWPRAAPAAALALALVVAADLFLQSLPWQRAVGLAPPPESRDHQPRPLGFGRRDVARAELVRFAPNALTYRVDAAVPTRLVFPLRYGARGAEWQAEGHAVEEVEGRLALVLDAGPQQVVLRYRPAGLRAGIAATALTCVALVGLAWRRARGPSAA